MDFILRNKFWLGLGAVVLLAIILFAVGPLSAMGENDEMFSTLEDRAEDLERYASEQVKNEKWREQQERIQRSVEKELRQIQEELLSRDALLEMHLKDPNTGEEGPLSFGRFVEAYDEKMTGLEDTLRESVIEIATESPLVHVALGRQFMPQSELHQYEKQVWIQEGIVEAVADVNMGAAVVPVFISLSFHEIPERLLSDAHRERFEAIPFELAVAMEFEFYPLFLQRLLQAPLGLEITSTNLERYDVGGAGEGRAPRRGREWRDRERRDRELRDRRRRPEMPPDMEGVEGYLPPGFERARPREREREDQEEAEEEQEPLPNDLVSVTIRGYVPDYLQPDEERSEGAEETEGPGGGSTGPGGSAPRFGPPGAPGARE